MSNLTNKNTSVPPSIELLFNNEKLDLVKTLCLMYAFSLKAKKRRKVSEIMFYYSLVNFDLIKLFETSEENRNGLSPSPNLYFRFETKINGILLNMSHLQFIDLKGDLTKKLDEITVQLTSTGIEFFEKMDSEFFSNLKEEYANAFEKVAFSANNLKVMKGVHQ
ncbi:hypothetical protein IHV12_22115 [Fictibacillus sp. 7GRE50]|uniref:hypothetical protein n=1 Tax=Fictibacillus sp. 7GRE50 TaxID=2745878 RepID=UPI0018CF9299|nr:hypothetical protein [Fictibacillus sp. 7GRE50]MBH0167608.1 hypothetical protein [Fictibacillus sp. 7GRE50]